MNGRAEPDSGQEVDDHGGRRDAIVEIRDLSVRIGEFELHVDELQIPRGSLTFIVGPSGAGKTTLLATLGLLLSPTRCGKFVLRLEPSSPPRTVYRDYGSGATDDALAADDARRLRMAWMGFFLDGHELIPNLSLLENSELLLALADHPEPRLAAKRALAAMGLEQVGDSLPNMLSGGQHVRARLARVLAPEPSLVLLDEPTSSLDEHTGAQIVELLKTKTRRGGQTVVVVSHDVTLAARYADVVVEMQAVGPARAGIAGVTSASFGEAPRAGSDASGVPDRTAESSIRNASKASFPFRLCWKMLPRASVLHLGLVVLPALLLLTFLGFQSGTIDELWRQLDASAEARTLTITTPDSGRPTADRVVRLHPTILTVASFEPVSAQDSALCVVASSASHVPELHDRLSAEFAVASEHLKIRQLDATRRAVELVLLVGVLLWLFPAALACHAEISRGKKPIVSALSVFGVRPATVVGIYLVHGCRVAALAFAGILVGGLSIQLVADRVVTDAIRLDSQTFGAGAAAVLLVALSAALVAARASSAHDPMRAMRAARDQSILTIQRRP